MNVLLRRAEEKDIADINELLFSVHQIHTDIRPDLFKAHAKKYTDEDLSRILRDDTRPVFVAERNGKVVGYCFCIEQVFGEPSFRSFKTLYIDDLCVAENQRGKHIGTLLYDHVLAYAEENGFYNVTLHVWEGNDSAKAFYQKVGMGVQQTTMEKILK